MGWRYLGEALGDNRRVDRGEGGENVSLSLFFSLVLVGDACLDDDSNGAVAILPPPTLLAPPTVFLVTLPRLNA
jgi:hypothetical protein